MQGKATAMYDFYEKTKAVDKSSLSEVCREMVARKHDEVKAVNYL